MLRFAETGIAGAWLVETMEHRDERGGFARLYCPQEFAAAGIDFAPKQISLSSNLKAHTLRGMHFQPAPHAEAKLVRVTHGAVFDVIADIRPDSPSYGKWQGFDLSRDNRRALFVPAGCAHGFVTLRDDTDVLYQIDRIHEPGHGAGFRYDDPAFAIDWPVRPAVMSDADRSWPDLHL